MAIDIGRNLFHVVGLDQPGATAPQQKQSRGPIEARLANMPPVPDWHGSLRWRTSPDLAAGGRS
jgi:hypothetical protein